MKKIILLVFCFSISFTAFSQSDESYNYSIGLRAYSSLQMPQIMSQTNSQSYMSSYFNGIMVKFNDNQISFRLNGTYFRKDITFFNQCNTCEIATGLVTDYSFKVGFEKNFNYAKVQPYFGSDIGYRANRFTGEVKTANPKSTSMPYNADAEKNGFVIAPFLGIRVTPIKQVSFFAETNIDFYYSYEKQETIQQDPQNTRSFTKYNKWEFLLNPISVGIQIHLVSKD